MTTHSKALENTLTLNNFDPLRLCIETFSRQMLCNFA